MASHRAQPRPVVPDELVRLERWIRHSATKVPLTVTGRPASTTNSCTWSSYAEAERSSAGAGMGFVLDGDGIVCVDLDHCLIDGQLADWAVPILEGVPATYIEVSPSGDGLHVWGSGECPTGRRRRVPGGCVEVYGTGRYITITGRPWRGSRRRLADLSDYISRFL